MTVYEKLCKVQSELKAPKNQYNSFGKYYYRSCEDIQEGLKPLLTEVGAIVTTGDEIILVGERYYIKATAKFIDIETGKEIINTALAREELDKKGMDASQITGTASSYARKYALNGLFCIDDTKDSDSNENKEQTKPQGNTQNNPQAQDKPKEQTTGSSVNRADLLKTFEAEIHRTGKSIKWFLEQAKASEVKFIKTEKLIEFVEMLKPLPNKEV